MQKKKTKLTGKQKEISKTNEELPKDDNKGKKKIKETKCICKACGYTWFYGKNEELEQAGNAMQNCGKSMSCCTGCAPAAFLPDKKVVDLSKCPKCGSKAVEREEITHYV